MENKSLTQFDFLILTSLLRASPEGRHGYGIIGDIQEMTEGLLTYAAPSVYDALARLQKAGLVEPAGDLVISSRLRRHYRITSEGTTARKEYEAEQDRIREGIRRFISADGRE